MDFRMTPAATAALNACRGYTLPTPSFPVLAYLRAGGPMLSLAVRMPGSRNG